MKRSSFILMSLLLAACTDATTPDSRNISLRPTSTMLASTPIEAVLPAAYTSIMGETNNSFPHSFKNLRYQQVFSGADVLNPEIVGLCLRRDDAFGGASVTQTLTVKLGPTSLDYTNLSNDFDANYSATPTEVFTGDVVIPSSAGNGTPTDFDFCIPFTQTYTHPAGSNVIVEVINTSLASGNVPRDACDGLSTTCSTSRAFAFSATATTAALVQRGGLVMKFVSPEPPEPVDPVSKDECMSGAWADFNFRNQGQCVRFVETGKDSRVELQPSSSVEPLN